MVQEPTGLYMARVAWDQITDTKQILDYLNVIVGTDYDEKSVLLDAARYGPEEGMILEIGCDLGQSLLALACGAKLAGRERVISIDVDIGRPKDLFWGRDARIQSGPFRWRRLLENIVLCGVSDWVVLLADNSMFAHEYLNLSLRLLYIDGGHDHDYTTNDIVQYGRMLVPGGLIFVHDYYPEPKEREPAVLEVVNRLIRDGDEYEDFHVVGVMACARKVGGTPLEAT